MLRASSQVQGNTVDLSSIVNGGGAGTGIAGAEQLTAFAEAAMGDDVGAIRDTRDALADALGTPATVDAAAVIANFQRMVRIADATGIPLDEPVLMMSQGIRAELGINDYAAAANSPELPWLKRLIGKLLAPLTPALLKRRARSRVPHAS